MSGDWGLKDLGLTVSVLPNTLVSACNMPKLYHPKPQTHLTAWWVKLKMLLRAASGDPNGVLLGLCRIWGLGCRVQALGCVGFRI